MFILKDNQIHGRYYGGIEPVIFDTLEEVEECLREIIEMDMEDGETAEGLPLWELLDITDYELERYKKE
jgi:hypothetical protein